MTRFSLILALLVTVPISAARRRAVATPVYPDCSMVTGTSAVAFTRDEGRTLIEPAVPLRGIAYTFGLTALDTPNTLMAWHGNDLLISTDAGCSWRIAATIPGADFPPTLEPARGGRVYAWSDNRQFLVRWDSRGAVKLKPPAPFIGLEADPNDGDHVRAAADDGAIWDSRDAGVTWDPLSRAPSAPGYYRVAFDPHNLDHIVVGALAGGAHVSFDGGRTWTRAPQTFNVTNVVISPVDGNFVWAMDTGGENHHILLSRDGGRTYLVMVEAGAEATLINQPVMVAHPTNRNVLYFVFGTFFQGYGTDLFRFDAATFTLTKTHNDHDDVDAIAFSPADPNVMYLGLESEH